MLVQLLKSSGSLFALSVVLVGPTCSGASYADESSLQRSLGPYFEQHCIVCHGEDEQMAGVAVHEIGSQAVLLEKRDVWERVLKMVQLGAMPPEEIEDRPSVEDNQRVARTLEEALFNFDCEQVARPGSPVIQRLNRSEYNNTIRDLFGIDISPADEFPSDDVGEGFDNIGGVLSVSPLLLEKYVAAAEQVTAAMIDTTDYSVPQTWEHQSARLKATHDHVNDVQGLRFLTEAGELSFEQFIPATGSYDILFDAAAMPPSSDEMEFELKVDGETASQFTVRHRQQPKKFKRKLKLTAGNHRFAFEFYGPYDEDETDPKKRTRLGIGRVVLRGPIGKSEPARSDLHRSIVTAVPDKDVTPQQAAERVVAPLLRRAFRRPVTDAEIKRYADFTVALSDTRDGTWERAVAATVQAILVSPDFLFRVESLPQPGEAARPLNDHELAVRLSYFLWSSMPDAELFRLADAGRLHDHEILAGQIRRMIADDKSQALVENFASQWLNLRILEDSSPDKRVFPEFSPELRQDMLRETASVFRHVMLEDLNVEQLLEGRFTFVNERLAAHYGIEGIVGNEFVQVSLQDSPRQGVLTHASVLTLTSYPRRTSPVQRGKWILENLFGDAPPPPPPNIPELEDAVEDATKLSVREQMAAHRTNPVCASCHQVMDPLGLGLENFDGIGRWRDEDLGEPVDSSGELPGGRTFKGPQELAEILAERREEFVRTLTEKMLTYATGRGLHYYDKCTVDQCLAQMAGQENRFSALVESIVFSDAFRKRDPADE